MHRFSCPRQANVPAFRVSAVRQHDDLVDRTALACIRGNGDALIDARTMPPHSTAVIQDELGIGDLPHLSNIIILEA
jgi:hypothetical protein